MRCIDGAIRLYARERDEQQWPATAVCDLSVTSAAGPSAAVYMTESDVRTLIRHLCEQIYPLHRGGQP